MLRLSPCVAVALTVTLTQKNVLESDYIDEFIADPILLDEGDSVRLNNVDQVETEEDVGLED